LAHDGRVVSLPGHAFVGCPLALGLRSAPSHDSHFPRYLRMIKRALWLFALK
jgi:hypothetical protein